MFFLFPRFEHPAGWICARYKSLLLLRYPYLLLSWVMPPYHVFLIALHYIIVYMLIAMCMELNIHELTSTMHSLKSHFNKFLFLRYILDEQRKID